MANLAVTNPNSPIDEVTVCRSPTEDMPDWQPKCVALSSSGVVGGTGTDAGSYFGKQIILLKQKIRHSIALILDRKAKDAVGRTSAESI